MSEEKIPDKCPECAEEFSLINTGEGIECAECGWDMLDKTKHNFWYDGGYFVDYIQRWVSQCDNDSFDGELPAWEEYNGMVNLCYKDYMQGEHPLNIDLWKTGFYLTFEEKLLLNIKINNKTRILSNW